MDKVRAGVIGCGKFAVAQHLPNCIAVENVELRHCSSRSESGRGNAERFGAAKVSSDYRELLGPSVTPSDEILEIDSVGRVEVNKIEGVVWDGVYYVEAISDDIGVG